MWQRIVGAKRVWWVAVFAALLAVSSSAPVFAESTEPPSQQEEEQEKPDFRPLPSGEEISEAIQNESIPPLEPEFTDPEAAEGVALSNLGRDEAQDLIEGVFASALSSPAGIFDELNVEKFLAPNVALIPAGEQPEGPVPADDEESSADYEGATLMDSTLPLSTESSGGELEAVDLNLEGQAGGLRPVNPLVDVTIPSDLGEGIELPGPDIGIELEGAPEGRAPSKVDGSVAFYPNVSSDTDFAVAPSPGGFETMTQLRSPDAPVDQTYNLALPTGASLEVQGGGAVITAGDETLMTVAPPAALDATGASVPAELTVDGTTVKVTVSPDEATTYPVLVDPLFQSFEWYAKHESYELEWWNGESWGQKWEQNPWYGTAGLKTSTDEHMTAFVPYDSRGLDAYALSTTVPGAEEFWIYKVPRYNSDPTLPETFITKMTASSVAWRAQSNALSPYMYMGLWGPSAGWASLYTHEGLSGHSINNLPYVYPFTNNLNVPDVKIGQIGLYSTENVTQGYVELFVGATTVELSEPASTVPTFSKIAPPVGWVNQGKASINFTATDRGLGVLSVKASAAGGTPTWKTVNNCTGVARKPCPLTWSYPLVIEPGLLPTGTNTLDVVAEDPLAHVSTGGKVQIAVDHVAPELTVAGSATEQATLGKKRPTYSVKVTDADGTVSKPQSGVAKVAIEVDGKVVKKAEPGCATENCTVPLEWTLEASQYAMGQHTIAVTATDGVGLSTTKKVEIELQPASPPTLALSGTMTEQATLGVTRKRYALKVNTSALAGGGALPVNTPTFSSSFGTAGTGNGQFAHPAGIAVDPKGNLWVVDENHYRVQKFNEAGAYLSSVGSQGTENGKFSRPTDVAVDAKGNIWVTDAGNNRIEEFNEKGEYVTKIGAGSGTFNGPESIAIDPKGNIWVGDTYNGRLQEFNEKGEFVRTVGSRGPAAGQIGQSTGVAVGPSGNIWVADWEYNRVVVFSETGTFIRQFGTEGTGNGQFKHPDVIDVDSVGNVWVGDQSNSRVQEFSQAGQYITQFGTAGSGPGQFSFGWPMGIATDSNGHIWVADTGNNRIQRWQVPYIPTYTSSFGSYGTAAGQFNHPGDVAIDSKGDLWVVDKDNNRLEEFTEAGGSPKVFGTGGRLYAPAGVVVDSSDNVWVSDTGHTRIVEFDKNGEFVATFGTNVNKTKVEAGGTLAEKNYCTAASKNVCQSGTAGSLEGQMKEPMGIAVSPGGNLFVVEKGNGRVEKFGPTGQILANFGTPGTGEGQLKEPTAVAIAPDGSLWVADTGNNRIQEWTFTYSFVRQLGKEGTANGEFKRPDAIEVDPVGNVLVGDQNNGRVQEFNENGQFITRFGSSGSGTGQFSFTDPAGIAVDAKGNVWVTDTGNNRIQRWSQQLPRSEVSMKVSFDGKQVSADKAICSTEACPLVSEWAFYSTTYAVGKHTVEVISNDGLGRSTTKSLAVEIQKDTTKPTLEAGGALFNAPAGWVEQGTYLLNASATDAGAGVTSIAFKVDGALVASQTQECYEGGCGESFSKSINTSSYAGGTHSAELVVTDGANNVTTKKWDLNVDPDGHITATEAEDTLEAADETTESTVVAPTSEVLEPEQIEHGLNPALHLAGSEIVSSGSPDITRMGTDPEDGFSIQSPEGTTEITPIVSESSSSISISEGVAGVSANIGNEVDSVIRPEYNGVQTFQAIRSSTSPESYSWKVHLPPKQALRLANPSQAEVFYPDGTIAFLITAEPAHDATGKPVPTSLEVKGEVLTLKVEFHSGTFVYPIVAGQGWETSYTAPVIVEGPEDEAEILKRLREEREEREREERERLEAEGVVFSESEELPPPPTPLSEKQAKWLVSFGPFGTDAAAPPYPSGGGASASTTRTFQIYKSSCGPSCGKWNAHVYNASFIRGEKWAKWEAGTQVHAGVSQSWKWEALIWDTTWNCGTVGPTLVKKGEGEHLIAYAKFTMESYFTKKGSPTITPTENNFALQDWVYPNGFQEKHVKDWGGQPSDQTCPKVAGT